MFQKVTLYDNARLGNKLDCQFRSEKSLNAFIGKYQYYGEALNFEYDLWEESNKSYNLSILTTTAKSFEFVMNYLYKGQDQSMREYLTQKDS